MTRERNGRKEAPADQVGNQGNLRTVLPGDEDP